jgi:hypothetical protein
MDQETKPIDYDQIPTSEPEDYKETDIFTWANNLVQYVDDLKIDLYLFNKNYTVYRLKVGGDVSRQFRPLFIDEILEYVLDGIDQGLIVRNFEDAEKEDKVLQRTRVKNVDKLVEVQNWLKTQASAIETFSDEEHDLKRMKGVIAVCKHADLDVPFYVIKSLPTSQIMKGHTAWTLKDGVFKPFDRMAALKIPGENQLLAIGQDLFVFSQPKLKALFGYDAKAALIARQKVAEIEANFKLSFLEGASLQSLVKEKPALVRKLQTVQPSLVTQKDLLDHAEEIDVELMEDDSGAIIIMDTKDLTKFVNLLNDDYIESPMTGQRYEIIRKKPLKQSDDDSMLPTV